jgi:nucleotide-binding universal stress UspA family protein
MYSDIIKDVLLPVDLGINTEFAVKQAIELTKATGATIHLLHIIPSGNDWSNHFIDRNEVVNDDILRGKELVKKLEEWQRSIEETMPGCQVKIYFMKGIVHDSILDAAKKIQPQLIIVGEKKKRRFFRYFRPLCPNEISILSHYPVLTVMGRTTGNRMQHIVMPVRDFIPKRKIGLLIVFARLYRAKIHLVSTPGKMNEEDAERTALLETYRLLKNNLSNPVEYHLLKHKHFPEATLQFAQKIGADMVFVNPGAETRTSLFPRKHINEMLPAGAGIKFIFVEPYPHDLIPAPKTA